MILVDYFHRKKSRARETLEEEKMVVIAMVMKVHVLNCSWNGIFNWP